MKILLAVDGSEFTKRMLAFITGHAEWLGGKHAYTVIHSVLAVPNRAASFVGAARVRKFYDEEAEAVLAPIRSDLEKHGIVAQFIATSGPAADAIATQAREGGFDLVVMGSHGHGELVNLVLGSVATKVLARCSTPVLLVR